MVLFRAGPWHLLSLLSLLFYPFYFYSYSDSPFSLLRYAYVLSYFKVSADTHIFPFRCFVVLFVDDLLYYGLIMGLFLRYIWIDFFVIILLLTIVYAFSQFLTDFTSDFLPGLYLRINNVSGQHELF